MKRNTGRLIFFILISLALTTLLAPSFSAAKKPADVTHPRQSQAFSNAVRLVWDPQKNVDGYFIYQKDNHTDCYKKIGVQFKPQGYTVKNLAANRTYHFAVKAVRYEGGKEVVSQGFETFSAYTMPKKVTALKAKVSDEKIAGSFKPSAGANGYEIYWKTTGAWHPLVTTEKSSFSAARPGTADRYTIGVKAFRLINGKKWISRDITTVSRTAPFVRTKVRNVTLSRVGATSAKLSWTKEPKADGYVIYRANGRTGAFKRIAKKNYPGYCVVKHLTSNSTYRFAVRAYRNKNGREVLSPRYEVILGNTLPEKVTGLNVTLSAERAYLTWNASKDAVGYVIYYNLGKGWKEYGTTTNHAYRNKYLLGGTRYTFGVKTYRYINHKRVISADLVTVSGVTQLTPPEYTITKKNNIYSLEWTAVTGASSYIVYAKRPGQDWVKKGVTASCSFSFYQANAPDLFVAVKAKGVIGSKTFYSDYWKKRVWEEEAAGTVYSFGDSVAKGMGSHFYSYAELFAERHDLNLKRRANNGACLNSSLDTHRICQNVIDAIHPGSEYDYILIEGGRNDYYHNCPIGSLTHDGDTNYNMNTVCGAMEAALSHLKTACPKAKVIFVMIHDAGGHSRKKNSLGLTFSHYAKAIERVCKKHGATVADVLHAGFDTSDEAISSRYTFHNYEVYPFGDNIHPSEEAYRLFYLPVIDAAALTAQPIGGAEPATEPSTGESSESPTDESSESVTDESSQPSTDESSEPSIAPSTDSSEPATGAPSEPHEPNE